MDNKLSTKNWSELLKQAVNEPGKLLEAYRAFHNYSYANCLLAASQLIERGLAIGPLATFEAWKAKGRHVKKGQKAIVLCRPVTFKVPAKKKEAASQQEPASGQLKLSFDSKSSTEQEETVMVRKFVYEAKWFSLSQTDGKDYQLPDMQWNKEQALKALSITEIPFEMQSGNCQGYAIEQSFAINPLAQLPAKTMFHEMAHILLGHTTSPDYQSHTGLDLPLNEKELEAESVALLCLASLDLPGVEYCRGYIQNWFKGNEIKEATAQRIMGVADKILKAGLQVEQAEKQAA